MGESALTDSLLIFGLMRAIHGMLNAATNPLSFSLIQDYFPPNKRSLPNSLIQAGNFVGFGISSLLIIAIE